ncbi:hypothetical protein IDVR_08800 [Intrasporangium sp. DVR]
MTTAPGAVEPEVSTPSASAGRAYLAPPLTGEVAYDVKGRYVDNDGFEVTVKVTAYRPIRLTDTVDAVHLCDPRTPNAGPGTATKNSILQAAHISFASTNPRFPFPLQKYSEPEVGRGLSQAQLMKPLYGSLGTTLSSCGVVDARNGSADYVVIAGVLAPPQATPDNPESRLKDCPDSLELWVGEPLSATMTASTMTFRSTPSTKYGPNADGPGVASWKFPVAMTPELKEACLN